MPTVTCPCGAKYRFPIIGFGRRAKCKHCGRMLHLHGQAPSRGDMSDAETPHHVEDSGPASPEPVGAAIGDGSRPDLPVAGSNETPLPPLIEPAGPGTRFVNSVFGSILFPSVPKNLAVFLYFWAILAVAPLLPCILVPIFLILWYAAFRFEVISTAAAGETDIPDAPFSREVVDDLIRPILLWVGSWLYVMVPAIGFALLRVLDGALVWNEFLRKTLTGVRGLVELAQTDFAFGALACLGLFMWPIVILCLTLGGTEAAYRVDLMFVTIARSWRAYLLVLAAFAAAISVKLWLFGAMVVGIGTIGTQRGVLLGGMYFEHIVVTGAMLYLDIVVCRLIGFYYHHYKRCFAWNWG